jgi:hypothetical protein
MPSMPLRAIDIPNSPPDPRLPMAGSADEPFPELGESRSAVVEPCANTGGVGVDDEVLRNPPHLYPSFMSLDELDYDPNKLLFPFQYSHVSRSHVVTGDIFTRVVRGSRVVAGEVSLLKSSSDNCWINEFARGNGFDRRSWLGLLGDANPR